MINYFKVKYHKKAQNISPIIIKLKQTINRGKLSQHRFHIYFSVYCISPIPFSGLFWI